jgi:hypothetical protein
MSTEVDIIERLPAIAGRCSFEQDRVDIIAATNLLTKLRAERDAAKLSADRLLEKGFDLIEQRNIAAWEMRERCARVAEYEAARWGMKVGSSARNAAGMIRALPLTVIATERERDAT